MTINKGIYLFKKKIIIIIILLLLLLLFRFTGRKLLVWISF